MMDKFITQLNIINQVKCF